MKYDDFIFSLSNNNPNLNIEITLLALWFDKKGDWNQAHLLVQNEHGKDFALIHAYLHRKEGDLWNANYWYKLAGEKMPACTIEDEWNNLAKKYTI